MAPNAAVPVKVTVIIDDGAAIPAQPFVTIPISCPLTSIAVAINDAVVVRMNQTDLFRSSKVVTANQYFLSYISSGAGTQFAFKANAAVGGTSYSAPPPSSRTVDIQSAVPLNVTQTQTETILPNTIDANPQSSYNVNAGEVKRVVAFSDTVFTLSLASAPSVKTSLTTTNPEGVFGEYDVVYRQYNPADSKVWVLNVQKTPPPALAPAPAPAPTPALPPQPRSSLPTPAAAPIPASASAFPTKNVVIGVVIFFAVLVACIGFYFLQKHLRSK
jgi:hypothetical protein